MNIGDEIPPELYDIVARFWCLSAALIKNMEKRKDKSGEKDEQQSR